MQGQVLAAASATQWGFISGSDGQRYHFRNEDVAGGRVTPGERVDFQASGQQAVDIYVMQAPPTRVAAAMGKRNWLAFYFSPKGRVSRREFWLLGVLPMLGCLLLIWIPVIGWALAIAASWAMLVLSIKRFHDRSYSGWWAAAGVVPGIAGYTLLGIALFNGDNTYYVAGGVLVAVATLIAILQFALVYVRAGVPGANAYGPDPLEGHA